METKYFEICISSIMQIAWRDFYFVYEFSSVLCILNEMIPTSFLYISLISTSKISSL